jgi:hypothetical protein
MRGPSRVLFENLCVEFEAAWDAMATTQLADRTSGSFLFARQAMLLVEVASTVAGQDAATFRRFSKELRNGSRWCSSASRTIPAAALVDASRGSLQPAIRQAS